MRGSRRKRRRKRIMNKDKQGKEGKGFILTYGFQYMSKQKFHQKMFC